MKSFDLEAAKSGVPIVTRDGREARFIAHVPEAPKYPVVVYIAGDTAAVNLTLEGTCYFSEDSRHDLFMKPQKHTFFINIWKTPDGRIECSDIAFDSEFECRKWAKLGIRDYVIEALPIELNE